MEYTARRTTAAEIVAHLGCPTHTFTANKKKEQSLYAFFFLVFRTRVDYYCHTLPQRDLSSSSSFSCRTHRQKKRADRSRKQTSFFLRRFSPGGRRADGRDGGRRGEGETEEKACVFTYSKRVELSHCIPLHKSANFCTKNNNKI